jgi:hypothetical protein
MNIGVLCVLKDWQALYIIHWHNEQYRKKCFQYIFGWERAEFLVLKNWLALSLYINWNLLLELF